MAPALRPFGGLFIAAVSGWLSWLAYTQAHRDGEFSMMAGLLGPAFFVIGVGIILFPGYREERLARGEDISKLEGKDLITPRWWTILVIGLALGGLHGLGLTLGWW